MGRRIDELLIQLSDGRNLFLRRTGGSLTQGYRPVGRSRWLDVEAGDVCRHRDGHEAFVDLVAVLAGEPAPPPNGLVVKSGRAWLAGE